MNEAIKILEEHKASLEKALNEWESKEYPEAKKIREKKLKELNLALELLKL